MVRCVFSRECKENFEQKYPSCLKTYDLANMLVIVNDFSITYNSSEKEK